MKTLPRASIKLASMLPIVTALVTVTSIPSYAASAPTASQVRQKVTFDLDSHRIQNSYSRETSKAGGNWYSYVTMVDANGAMQPIINQSPDHVIQGYSVNKLAVALAVLDKVDRGQVKLTQKLTLTPDIIASGSGMYFLQQGNYGDELTVANLLNTMLLISDNTAVRMLSQVAPGTEINEILARKGFVHTRVDPVPNSTRFFLGETTPREMQMLLTGVANHTLLSESSSTFMLTIMRWVNGYSDGIRHDMSSPERIQVATKYGALDDSRHEVGIMFDADGKPAIIYNFFNDGIGDIGNYGATNPAVEAEAGMGRVMFDVLEGHRYAHPTF